MTTVVWGRAAARRTAVMAELARLTPLLCHLRGVGEAWVFGSTVTGGMHATSDLDLLVVRDTDEPAVVRGQRLLGELEPRVAVDAFVYTPDEMRAGGRFVDDVRRRGRRIC